MKQIERDVWEFEPSHLVHRASIIPSTFESIVSLESQRRRCYVENEGRWPTSIAPINPCRPEILCSLQWMVAKVL